MLKNELKILITGGGSGGHFSVAKSLIDTLISDYNIPIENITYVGGDLGMEGEKAGNSLEQKQFKNAEFKTFYIRAGKLQRKISIKTLLLLFRSFLGFLDAISILKKVKPTFVISSGGFVSVPVCLVARIFKKPIYLHEQTATVGLANKIVGKFAKKVFISFKNSTKYFPKGKSIHSGNIIKKDIFNKNISPDTDKEIVTLSVTNKELPFIYISGGSLGSHSINTKVIDSIHTLLRKYRVLLQTGENEKFKDYQKGIEIKNSLPTTLKERFVVKKYVDIHSIGYVLNNMDLFVGRSGANTVYEIGVLRKNALFIPIPWATHNEQYLNAKVLEDLGLAHILEERYLADCNLEEEIERFKEQLKNRDIDKEKLEELFPTNAIYFVIDTILKEYLKD
jgi:UDP-N-acetylglucosamine--N-acetylmuramyl-(pentapeptide) pyrophosphoryl-undecaprenol N-acetylglucosamine transferase